MQRAGILVPAQSRNTAQPQGSSERLPRLADLCKDVFPACCHNCVELFPLSDDYRLNQQQIESLKLKLIFPGVPGEV